LKQHYREEKGSARTGTTFVEEAISDNVAKKEYWGGQGVRRKGVENGNAGLQLYLDGKREVPTKEQKRAENLAGK